MGHTHQFTVIGQPIPKARPRVVLRKGKKPRAFTPATTKAWEETVAWAYKLSGGPLFTGLLSVSMKFYRRTMVRADIDNLTKACGDALNKVAWDDDFQIRHLEAWLVLGDSNPRVEVSICEIEKGDGR